jgi:restriction endonuclease Mrr
MAQLSSQIIARWAIQNLESEEWILLSDICMQGIRKQNKFSELIIEESVERELDYVAEILRNNAACATEHGELVTYEIDDEQSPYIKKNCEAYPPILAAIRDMNSIKFEVLCAKILNELGWSETGHIGGTQDDGVDFYAFGFPNNQLLNLPMPPSCKVLLIGQAKCYKQDNNASETEIRKFVGGALKKLNDFRQSGKVGALTPVVFAFWITSDFDNQAKEYAKTMGVWFMNGRTLIEYLNRLNLEKMVD